MNPFWMWLCDVTSVVTNDILNVVNNFYLKLLCNGKIFYIKGGSD